MAGSARGSSNRGAGRRVRAVLFDLDDTLYDHTHAARAALSAMRRDDPRLRRVPFGTLLDRSEAILADVHRSLVLPGRLSRPAARRERIRRLYGTLGVPLGEAEADRVASLRQAAYAKHVRTVPGAVPLLRALRRSGRAIGIVSNHRVAEQRAKLAATGLDRLVDHLTVSSEVGWTKPDRRIFHAALDRAGCAPAEAVMVGDAYATDVVGALDAGLAAVWFNRFGRGRPDRRPGVVELDRLAPVAQTLPRILAARPALRAAGRHGVSGTGAR